MEQKQGLNQSTEVQTSAAYWPNSSQLRQQLSVPLSLTFTPTSQENNSATFNDKNMDQFRCQSCKAFINKYCILKGQKQYQCSLCGSTNYTESTLKKDSPQMTLNSYKCKASKVLRSIVGKQRLFVFVLDFSNYSQLSQKYLLYSIHAIRQFLTHALAQKKNIKVMLVGFDNGIQLFHIKNQVQRVVYWEDHSQKSTVSQYPFSTNQIGVLSQCQENIFLVLDTLEQQVQNCKFTNRATSEKIMATIQYSLKHSKAESGKIFIVSGLNHELQKFQVMKNYDQTVQDAYKHHYATVKKQCIDQSLNTLLNTTQMSVSLFFHSNNYINMIPFYIVSKSTNGQLRQYLKNQTEHFFYQFNYLLHQTLYEMKFETVLRVRSGIGLKMVGIFGQYRPWKGITDQIEILSCQSHRKYVFQFIIEGKVNAQSTYVQFSILYTDLKGNRHFKIVTQLVNLSSQIKTLISGINYQMVNLTYLKAILHNIDLTPYFRKLQLALQERCKKHIKLLRELSLEQQSYKAVSNEDILDLQYMKNVKKYVLFTYMLMKHFVLNPSSKRQVYLDLSIQIRSKLSTSSDYTKIVWPIIYIVNSEGYEIVQMKDQHFQKASIGVVIDRGDQIYVYIADHQIRNTLKGAKNIRQAISAPSSLQKISNILDYIQQKSPYPHLDILILESNFMNSFNIFSRKGNHSFGAFVDELISN